MFKIKLIARMSEKQIRKRKKIIVGKTVEKRERKGKWDIIKLTNKPNECSS